MLARDPKIPIITIISQGLEFDYVFLASLEDRVFPTFWSVKKGNIEEEKRLFLCRHYAGQKRGCI